MATPIIEAIAVVIKAALETITIANGYNYDVTEVIRPSRVGVNPKNGTCVLEQGSKRPAEESALKTDEWVVPFFITLYTRPSDTSTTALDTLGNQWGADVEKAVASDPQFATAVLDSWVSDHGFIETDGSNLDGIQVEFVVNFGTAWRDPYTARGS